MAIYSLRIYGKEYKISSRYDESYVKLESIIGMIESSLTEKRVL